MSMSRAGCIMMYGMPSSYTMISPGCPAEYDGGVVSEAFITATHPLCLFSKGWSKVVEGHMGSIIVGPSMGRGSERG